MTTLQEAVKKFIEATKLDRIEFEDWPRDSQTAFETLRTALAQQGEQQPVAWRDDIKVLADVYAAKVSEFARSLALAREDDSMSPVSAAAGDARMALHEAIDTAAPAPQAQEPIAKLFGTLPVYDTPAPQPAQDDPEVGFGNIPTKFLANGTRFKLSFDTRGRVSSLWHFMDELDGRWVALVAAEDDCHLQSAQPVAQYDKTEMNAFVTDLYQRKSTDGQHGFYETLFHVVHKAIARVGIREVK